MSTYYKIMYLPEAEYIRNTEREPPFIFFTLYAANEQMKFLVRDFQHIPAIEQKLVIERFDD